MARHRRGPLARRRLPLPANQVAMLPRRSLLVLAETARSSWIHGADSTQSGTRTGTGISATFTALAG